MGKFVLALLFLAAVAFSTADAYYGYWGDPWGYRYYGVKPAPTHETKWVDGYGYAIHPIAKEERKKREAVAVPEPEPEPAILGTTHSAPAVPLVAPYAIGAPLLPAVPINPTAVHKGSEVIPGAVTAGDPIAGPTVYAGHLGYGLPYHGWGYGYGIAHPPVVAAAPAAAPAEAPAAVDDADAEADPESWYYGYYGYPYRRYYGYGYGYYGGYGGYYGHPYGYGYYYGK